MFDPDLYLLEPRHQRYLEQGQGRIYAYSPNFEAPCVWFFAGLLIMLLTIAAQPLLWYPGVPICVPLIYLAIFPVLSLFMMWRGLKYPRLLRRLGREGQLVRGEVVSVRQSAYRKANTERPRIEMHYHFHSPTTGKTITAEVNFYLRQASMPEKGTALAVLYGGDTFYKPL